MATPAEQQVTFDKLGFAPTDAQRPILACENRNILVAGGERSGKSYISAMYLICRAHEGELFWLVGAEYENVRAEFEYICEALEVLVGTESYTRTKRIDPGEISCPVMGFRVLTKSARDPRKLGMQAPNGIVACEAAQMDYETYLRLRGRAIEKHGWFFLSGTFESSLGWYPEFFNRWRFPNTEGSKSFSLPTWTNTVIFPGGRQDPELLGMEQACSVDWFNERYGGIPCPPKGRVFTEFSNEIHTGTLESYEFDPVDVVYLWVDPGYAHCYAVEVAQKRGEQIFIVDEIYEKGLVTSDIINICRQKPWWNKICGGAVDIAARQHQAMPAVAEIWEKEAGIHLKSQKIRIQDGIEVLKSTLKVDPITNQPKIFINTKCQGLISELGGAPNPFTGQTTIYKWKMDREGIVIGDVPEDKNCDAVKATVYGLVDLVGYTYAQETTKLKVKFI